MDKKAAEKFPLDSTCIKCGKPADRRFSVESDHGFIFLCSSQECYNSLVNELRDLRNDSFNLLRKMKYIQ